MNFVDLIKRELEIRRVKNPRYSLRAFARDLEISPASLSGILNGGKLPSTRVIKQCSISLKWSKSTLENFLSEAKMQKEFEKYKFDQMRLFLDDNFYHKDLDWPVFAISRLAQLKENSASPNWISQRLNISKKDVKRALDFLIKFKCIEIVGNKMLFIKRPAIVSDQSTEISLKIQDSILDKAKESLTTVGPDERQGLILFSLMDKNKVKRIGDLMRRFGQEVEKAGESTNSPMQVYSMIIQLFPLDKK